MRSLPTAVRRAATCVALGALVVAGPWNVARAQQIQRFDSLDTSSPIPAGAQSAQSPQDQEQGDDPYARFITWLKLDGLWMPGQIDGGFYGLVGMHLAVAKVGRLYVFGPPGVMLVMQDTAQGKMVRPGFTWGFSYALTDVQIPNSARRAQIYLTLGRCWLTGGYANGLNMVGLSVTWKN